MPKGRPMRRANGKGTVVKLSGRRRCPYEVRVNTRMDERYYPIYDVLGRYADRDEATAALIAYNQNPYDLRINELTFADVYEKYFERKYLKGKRQYSTSSINCTKMSFKKCASLHNRIFKDLRTDDLQAILDDWSLSHAYMEHIRNLFNQMYDYAMQYDIVQKDVSKYVEITKPDDDEHGVPFTPEEIDLLWKAYENHTDNIDMVLILIYSGWRIGELLTLKLEDIDLENLTYKGGIKTAAGKNRIVPIHSKIVEMVRFRKSDGWFQTRKDQYTKIFKQVVSAAGVQTYHTPHDCRHTFVTLLSNAKADEICIKRLVGHSSGNDVTEKIYTHKDIEQLRLAIEKI